MAERGVTPRGEGPTRRALLGATAVSGAALAAGLTGCSLLGRDGTFAFGAGGGGQAGASTAVQPDGVLVAGSRLHRPEGVVTPQPVQLRLRLATLDVTGPAGTPGHQTLAALLADLSAVTASLRRSRQARTTVTLGVGPALFDHRFGLAARRPRVLQSLPHFRGDRLVLSRCDGDLLLQVCADDDAAADAAMDELLATVGDRASVRWMQHGLRGPGAFPRNLFGYHDGQGNPAPTDAGLMQQHVWIGEGADVPWLVGGTYLVVRRMRMDLAAWAGEPRDEQDRAIGRERDTGAPLTGGTLTTEPDLRATRPDGRPVIATDAHVRMMGADSNGGVRILRRGFDYADSHADRGMVFAAYTHDPTVTFVPLQHRMAAQDKLHEYVTTTVSGVYAVPPDHGEDPSWHRLLLG